MANDQPFEIQCGGLPHWIVTSMLSIIGFLMSHQDADHLQKMCRLNCVRMSLCSSVDFWRLCICFISVILLAKLQTFMREFGNLCFFYHDSFTYDSCLFIELLVLNSSFCVNSVNIKQVIKINYCVSIHDLREWLMIKYRIIYVNVTYISVKYQ